MEDLPTLQEFYDMVARQDWYYEMSYDHRVWRAGENYSNRLKSIANLGGEQYQRILTEFSQHYYSGQSFGTEKQPKPQRPE